MPDSQAPPTTSSTRPVICVFCGSAPGKSPAHMAAARELAQALHRHGIKLVYGGGTVGIMGELARTLVALAGTPDIVHGVIPDALVKYEQTDRPLDHALAQAQSAQVASSLSTSNSTSTSNSASNSTPNSTSTPASTSTPSVDSTSASASKPSGSGNSQPAREWTPVEKVYGRQTHVPDMHTRKGLMAREVLAGGPGSGFVALSGGYGTLEELMEVATWNQLGIHSCGVCVFNVEGYWDGLLQWISGAVDKGFIGPKSAAVLVEATTAEDTITKLREYTCAEGRLALDWTKK